MTMAKKSSARNLHLAPSGRIYRAVPILACLVLLHALISAPLLVQCIGADGRGLIEVLGNDPCHALRVPNTGGPAKGPAARGFATSDPGTDPCRDLLLDNPGCNSPHAETAPATARAADSAATAHRPCAATTGPGPMREPGDPPLVWPGLHPRSFLILRI